MSFKKISDSVIIGKGSKLRSWAAIHENYQSPFQLKIVDAELGNGFHMAREHSACALLLVCYSGHALIETTQTAQEIVISAGEAIFCPQNEAISYRSYQNSRFGHFGLEWLDAKIAPRPESGSGVLFLKADPIPFRHAYEGLCYEIIYHRHGVVFHDWLAVMDHLARRVIMEHDPVTPLSTLIHNIEKSPQLPWSLPEMAESIGVSESTLRRLFHRDMGESPSSTLTRIRLTKAAGLLVETKDKLESIARECGYSNAYALSKAFREKYSIPPRQYRVKHSLLAKKT